jgi:hypothetical protein
MVSLYFSFFCFALLTEDISSKAELEEGKPGCKCIFLSAEPYKYVACLSCRLQFLETEPDFQRFS